MIAKRYPYYLANRPTDAAESLEVRDKYRGDVVCEVAVADEAAVERAIAAAVEAAPAMRALPPYERARVLEHCTERLEARKDELAAALCAEAGKPIKDARGEVTRLIDTFRYAAGEAIRVGGELLNLEISARARGYRGMTKRVAVGPCAFITPFNFPLNLVAHKVAPALAIGCPFVLKPASKTPIGALIIGEILADAGLPDGAFSIMPMTHAAADPLVTDPRIRHLSFTGSGKVGWDMKRRAGRKHVGLELGGNAACVVDADADLNDAAQRLIVGAFYQSGQSCISVQRIIAHTAIYDELRERLVTKAKALKVGDPRDEGTFIGPMISTSEAERVEAWIAEAKALGAEVLCGGTRDGAMIPATLLENVPRQAKCYSDEVFGPVACLSRFDDFGAALDEVNDSEYGLQAGVFTRDIHKIHRAWDTLEVGGVVIGDIPSWRVDHMPYGGVKASGTGREGIRYAIEAMSELRLLILRDPPG
ncbi:MAG: aldehyde dehydrogenase family protein [Myxococcales bacterium]|nr:aldehyde dehydrogenase family protein [Myxococcales bacterium]